MTMWCSTNWAELLLPAPLSIVRFSASPPALTILMCTIMHAAPSEARVAGDLAGALTIWALSFPHSTAGRPARVPVEVRQAPGLIQNVAHAGHPVYFFCLIQVWRPLRPYLKQIPDVICNLVIVL